MKGIPQKLKYLLLPFTAEMFPVNNSETKQKLDAHSFVSKK